MAPEIPLRAALAIVIVRLRIRLAIVFIQVGNVKKSFNDD